MKTIITGTTGHLGEALVRTLRDQGHDPVGLDILPGPCTTHVGSIVDRDFVRRHMHGIRTVFHAATLHKPHVATHTRQQFIDTNITGTLNLLEEASAAGVEAFIYTSTTSVFGDGLTPPPGRPAAWITEEVAPVPKNIYGVTKAAAEDLCQLFFRNKRLPCLVLRTSRFFPEEDDNKATRETYADANIKLNEFLYRRVDVEDVASSHLLAAEKARALGFRKYIISATTPFARNDLAQLRTDAPGVVRRIAPDFEKVYAAHNWKMNPSIDRVYDNTLARTELGWQPKYDFKTLLDRLHTGQPLRSPLAQSIGSKGYHAETFAEGPFPVE